MASFRVLIGTDVLYCGSSLVAAGGTFHFETTEMWIEPGSESIEVVLSSDASPIFGAGDRHYEVSLYPITSGGSQCNGTFSETRHLDALVNTQGAITWSPGHACPGN